MGIEPIHHPWRGRMLPLTSYPQLNQLSSKTGTWSWNRTSILGFKVLRPTIGRPRYDMAGQEGVEPSSPVLETGSLPLTY